MSEGGSVDEMSGKKGHQFSLQRVMTKKRLSVFFEEKICDTRVTPTLVTPLHPNTNFQINRHLSHMC